MSELAGLYTVNLTGVAWRKSSYTANNSNCVEVADLVGAVATRDTKWRTGPVLTSTAEGWRAFVAGVVEGEFGTA